MYTHPVSEIYCLYLKVWLRISELFQQLDWWDANKFCLEKNMRLASVTSEEDMQRLKSQLISRENDNGEMSM